MVFAAKNCRVIEYQDHFEAVCFGDPNYTLKQPEHAAPNSAITNGAQVSRQRRRIEEIRSLNAHRFDAVEANPSPDGFENKK